MICPNCGSSFKPMNSDFLPYCSEGCQRRFREGTEVADSELGERLALLEDLVRHCQIHSGYQNCGYNKMSSELKSIYDEITGRERP